MKSISFFFSIAAAVLLAASHVSADPVANPLPDPATPALKAMTTEGCYSASTVLTFNSTYTYMTAGWCQPLCVDINQAVLATSNGSACYCGNELPPTSSKVDSSYCNVPCVGYPADTCGGDGYFNVYLSGISTDVEVSGASSSSSTTGTTSTTSANPSVVTVGGQTIVVTASSSASSSSSSSSPSKASVAAGVVVGIVAIGALAGGGFLFIRNHRRRQVEEEFRRTAAVNSFIHSSKPPTSSGGASSINDMRLDPSVMASRRMTDGSIADNQDYSRRILKVINV